MVGITSAKGAVRRRFIAAKYKAHARDGRSRFSLAALRLHELERLFKHRWGNHLPDDDAGRDDLLLAFNQNASIDACIEWAAKWAPWLSLDDSTALAEQIAAAPQWLKARPLGVRLGLTDAERKALRIRTARPIDVTDLELVERRRKSDKERKALRRRLERAAKPAPASQTKPWEEEGISRRTWYRRKSKPIGSERGTKSVRNKLNVITADGFSATKSQPADAGPTPTAKDFGEEVSREPIPTTPKKRWVGPTQVGENWQPSEAGKIYAQSKGMPRQAMALEVSGFINWHLMYGKSPWPNVDGAWRSWCDRYLPYENERDERDRERRRRDEWFRRLAG